LYFDEVERFPRFPGFGLEESIDAKGQLFDLAGGESVSVGLVGGESEEVEKGFREILEETVENTIGFHGDTQFIEKN
jgi:hypothetical protein